MQIRELEARAGMERASIRYYEREGLLCPARQENGYRDYSEADLNELLRIRLLRQLGLSVEAIRALQQGTLRLADALTDRQAELAGMAVNVQRAGLVCRALCSAAPDYHALDAAGYLEQLAAPIGPQELAQPKAAAPHPDQTTAARIELPVYREPLPAESHPFRRFFARLLDHTLLATLLYFVAFSLLRVRPMADWATSLLSYAAWWLLVPVEALLLWRFGATPGKWLFALRVEDSGGRRLPFFSALRRSFGALRWGMGFAIPAYSLFRLYRSYRDEADAGRLPWETETDCLYSRWARPRQVLLAGALGLDLALTICIVRDSYLPRYRGELTPAQFAANYNGYSRMVHLEQSSCGLLNPDGSWYEPPDNGVYTVYLNGAPHPPAPLEFDLENGMVRGIHCSDHWEDFDFAGVQLDSLFLSALALMGAQEGADASTVTQFADAYRQMVQDGSLTQATLEYGGLSIRCQVHAQGCTYLSDGTYWAGGQSEAGAEGSALLDMDFSITLAGAEDTEGE